VRSGTSTTGELRPRTPEPNTTEGGDLSPSQKNRLRRQRSRSLYRSMEILTERERTLDEQRVQIVEHRRSLTSYASGKKDAR
jgi:hypothetical protein